MMQAQRMALIAVVSVVAVAFSACSGDTTTNVAGAQQQVGITVSGRGEVQVVPDIAHLTVGVEARARTVAEARGTAATAAERVIASLKSNGIDSKDIQTAALNVSPEYNYSGNSQPAITGYIVTNSLRVKVRKLDQLSKVIDDSLAAGGDNARLNGVSFGVEDDAKAKESARETAMKDARTKAEQLAKAGGVSIGKPMAISETQGNGIVQPLENSFGAKAADSATPIETGTNTILVDVVVTYAIDG